MAVRAQEVVIKTPATAVITATAVARVVVTAQRIHERAGDGRGQRQPNLVHGDIPGDADLDLPQYGSRGINSIDPVDEVPQRRNNIISADEVMPHPTVARPPYASTRGVGALSRPLMT